jgi:tRNA A37 methylthiotransferase MiaB
MKMNLLRGFQRVGFAKLQQSCTTKRSLHFHIETYGCQMNVNDSEIVRSILLKEGHTDTNSVEAADLILTNTCAVRENAEAKVFHRLNYFQSIRHKNRVSLKTKGYPIVGVLGCMAERMKEKLLERDSVDFICGPDAYRDIPSLLSKALSTDQKHANVQLSLDETYADITPVRRLNTSHSAFVSIMRGCNNMCSFCIGKKDTMYYKQLSYCLI